MDDSFRGVKCGIAQSVFSQSASRSEICKECQANALADHFGMLMKSDTPPSLEALLKPLPQDLRRSLHFDGNIESILPILGDDNATKLQGFMLDKLIHLVRPEPDLVELLPKQETLLYFLLTYAALVQSEAARHGLRIIKPLFDGQTGAGDGVAAMKRQWASVSGETPETESAVAGGPDEKGARLLPFTDTPAYESLVKVPALELVDVACKMAAQIREDRLSRMPRLHDPRALTTLLLLMDDVQFAHKMLATSATGSKDAIAVSFRLERVKEWQRTGLPSTSDGRQAALRVRLTRPWTSAVWASAFCYFGWCSGCVLRSGSCKFILPIPMPGSRASG